MNTHNDSLFKDSATIAAEAALEKRRLAAPEPNKVSWFKNVAPRQWAYIFGGGGIAIAGLIAALTLFSGNLDVRNQASTQDGVVTISSAQNGLSLPVGEPANVLLAVNTAGVQTDGIQLSFTVSNQATDGTAVFDPATFTATVTGTDVQGNPLDALVNTVEPVGSDVRVTMFLAPTNPESAVSSTTAQTFLTLAFTPAKPGLVSFTFDQNGSIVTQKNILPPKDVLKTLQPMQLTFFQPTVNTAPVGSMTGEPGLQASSGSYLVSIDKQQSLKLMGSGSDDQDAPEELSYLWELTIPGQAVQTFSTREIAAVPFNGFVGTASMKLTVTDTAGLSDPQPKLLAITITEKIPVTAQILEPSKPEVSGFVNEGILFTGTGTNSQGNSDGLNYSWKFSDGQEFSEREFKTAFEKPGKYEGLLVVTDKDGVSSKPASVVIAVEERKTEPSPTISPNDKLEKKEESKKTE